MSSALRPIAADQARAMLDEEAARAAEALGTELVPLEAATGRVLARALVAREDLPPVARSMMDGYAVRSADLAGATAEAPRWLAVVGAVVMGEAPGRAVGAGQAMEIPTGGEVPAGADAVVAQESARRDGGQVGVSAAVAAGRNVLAAGGELARGAAVIGAGRRLRAVEVGVLAALGQARVEVKRRPRVAVLSTGSELCAPSETPAPGQVRDMNQVVLGARARDAGCDVTLAGVVDDDPAALEAAVRGAAAAHQVVIVSGGSSVGARDHTAAVFQRLGPPGVLFHGLQVRPGRPTMLARAAEGAVLLGLPGVPAAALVIFEVFVRPLLRRLSGEGEGQGGAGAPPPEARLAQAHVSVRGREDYLRVRLHRRDGQLWAEPTSGGGGFAGVLAADGLVVVPADVESLAAGALVAVQLFG
jgi:molybdopterin molybdotransferase